MKKTGRAKKDDWRSQVRSGEKLGKSQDQPEQYSKTNCVLVHGSSKQKEEMTDEVIINSLNEKLDSEITFGD